MATKHYIGSGKKHERYDSITVTLKLAELEKYAFETEHGTFITFVVSARREVRYGQSHSAFVLVDSEGAPEVPAAEETAVAEPTEAPKKKRRTKK